MHLGKHVSQWMRLLKRYLDLLTILPCPLALLQHRHWVLVHLIVRLVPQPVLIALRQKHYKAECCYLFDKTT